VSEAAATEKPLPEETEVVVIGGGIVGCAAAYFLAKRGVPVALFEKGRIGGEQSSRNWGWVRKQGRDPLELPAVIESLKIWEGLEEELQADVGWRQGGVTYLAETDEALARYEAWMEHARAYQLDTRLLSAKETDALLGQEGRRWKGALYTASDGRAEPAEAAPALARGAERLGAAVFTGCAVRSLVTAGGRVAGVVTERGEVRCRNVVCAAGAWSGLFSGNLGVTLPQLRVRASALRTKPAPLVTESAVSSPGASVRRRRDGGYTVALAGAVDFELVPDAFRHFMAYMPAYGVNRGSMRLRLTGAFFRELAAPRRWSPDQVTPFERTRVLDPAPDQAVLKRALAGAVRLFPELAGIEMAEGWAGMIDTMPDALPVMDALDRPEGYFIATGFSGHGFGIGPGAGLLMSELVAEGRARVDLHPFRLSRFTDGTRPKPHTSF
jgi:glycine/D-amino acid oxidase-like deaminating enzyme